MKTKAERLAIFIARLGDRAPFSNHQEALEGIAATLNEVENEFSGTASNPTGWESDGRLYPPQEDLARPDSAREGVVNYRSRGHNTFIGENGAVEIVVRNRGKLGVTVYRREGVDGEFLKPMT